MLGALLILDVKGLAKMAKSECCALMSEKRQSNSLINWLNLADNLKQGKPPETEAEML